MLATHEDQPVVGLKFLKPLLAALPSLLPFLMLAPTLIDQRSGDQCRTDHDSDCLLHVTPRFRTHYSLAAHLISRNSGMTVLFQPFKRLAGKPRTRSGAASPRRAVSWSD
jgi:hypothetical protein